MQNASSFQNLLPTGTPSLDEFLGGGWIKGKISQLSGPMGGGKTTLALRTASILTQERKWVALISPGEELFPPAFQEAGIELHYLLWIRPSLTEHCLWALDQVTRSGLFPLVITRGVVLNERFARKLQLSAETSGTCVLTLASSADQQSAHDKKTPWAFALHLSVERVRKNAFRIQVIRSRKYLLHNQIEVTHDKTNQNFSAVLPAPSRKRCAS
jgi:hypothetical protein